MLLSAGKTLLLYVGILLALYISDRLGPVGGDAALKQTVLVVGAAAVVALGALVYAVYKAFTQSPQWWMIVAMHVVLSAAIFIWLSL